jgi:replicative DNA helicase
MIRHHFLYFDLRAKARRLVARNPIIIVDYLQLMTAGGNGRRRKEQEIQFLGI